MMRFHWGCTSAIIFKESSKAPTSQWHSLTKTAERSRSDRCLTIAGDTCVTSRPITYPHEWINPSLENHDNTESKHLNDYSKHIFCRWDLLHTSSLRSKNNLKGYNIHHLSIDLSWQTTLSINDYLIDFTTTLIHGVNTSCALTSIGISRQVIRQKSTTRDLTQAKAL